MVRDVQRLAALSPERARAFGNKARTLSLLTRRGFAVPPGYAIAAVVAERFAESVLAPADRLSALIEGPPVDESRVLPLAKALEEAQWPFDLERTLLDVYDAMRVESPDGIAVRSSSLVEDEGDASAAGMNATILGVRSAADFLEAIRKCWASSYSVRAIHYLKSHARGRSASMGVVVQAMVRAEVAGVAFTRHPLTGDDLEVVIESSWGLGTTIARGGVAPDIVRVNKHTLAVRDRVVGEKGTMEVLSPTGPKVVDVTEELRRAPSLDDARAIDVARLATAVETAMGTAVDVEFAFSKDTLHLLQARPVGGTRKTSR